MLRTRGFAASFALLQQLTFKGSRFGCGSSVRAGLGCTSKTKAHIAVVGRATAIAASLHSRAVVSLWPLGSRVSFAVDVLVSWIGEADSAYVGRAVAFAAFGLRTFGR